MPNNILSFKKEKAKLTRKRDEELFHELSELEGRMFEDTEDIVPQICKELGYKMEGMWIRDPRNHNRIVASIRINRFREYTWVKE